MGRLYANSMQFYTTDLSILDFGILGVLGGCVHPWNQCPLDTEGGPRERKAEQDRCPVRKVTQSFLSTFRFSSTLVPSSLCASPVLLSLSHPEPVTDCYREVHSEPSRGAVTKSSMPKLQVHNCTNSKIKQSEQHQAGVTAMWEGTFCAIWESLALGSAS